jgi:hypothetical protein
MHRCRSASVPPGGVGIHPQQRCVWTQQGEKLASTGKARQATSVALSADGNIAVVGGIAENSE